MKVVRSRALGWGVLHRPPPPPPPRPPPSPAAMTQWTFLTSVPMMWLNLARNAGSMLRT